MRALHDFPSVRRTCAVAPVVRLDAARRRMLFLLLLDARFMFLLLPPCAHGVLMPSCLPLQRARGRFLLRGLHLCLCFCCARCRHRGAPLHVGGLLLRLQPS